MLTSTLSSKLPKLFLLTGLSAFCSHELTHHVIAQLVLRPQDMSDLTLITLSDCTFTLHTKQDTTYVLPFLSAFSLSLFFFSAFFFSFSRSFTHTHTQGLSLTQLVWDSCLRQHRCVWSYLRLWFAPLLGSRSRTVSSYKKKREMGEDKKKKM